MIKKILLAPNGKRLFVKDTAKDYHCQYGYVTLKQLSSKSGTKLMTNTGKQLVILDPSFIDTYKKISRGPQIIAQKDIGAIISETGINKNSYAVDAGGGSGALSFFLANICKKVVTYELREDFAKILENNKKMLGLKNIIIKNKDIYLGITEKNLDLITLDLPEPWKVISHAAGSLRSGGFLVSYSPTIPQVSDFVEAASKSEDFIVLKTKEILERKWEFNERKIRPFTKMLAHTGFLTFCRKT